MKQKIIIEFATHCGKCRTTALRIAAEAEGVTEVALDGADKNKLRIIGENVDAVCLTKRLRKKLCHARLETVEEVKQVKKEEKPAPAPAPPPPPPPPPPPQYICCPGQPQFEIIRLEPFPSPCTIL